MGELKRELKKLQVKPQSPEAQKKLDLKPNPNVPRSLTVHWHTAGSWPVPGTRATLPSPCHRAQASDVWLTAFQHIPNIYLRAIR